MIFKTITFASILLLGNTAYANDTTVTVAAGGIITPKKEPDVKIKNEILTISPNKISVKYQFLNIGETKKVTVAFPLPKAPYTLDSMHPYASWDEAQHAYRSLYGDADKEHQPLYALVKHPRLIDFKTKINDQSYEESCTMRAYDPNGKDITDLLKQHNIPISSAYLRGFAEQPPIDKFPGLIEKIKSLNLTNKEGYPNWQLQITYFREQTFKKDLITTVTHEYTPYTGAYWVGLEAMKPTENEVKITYGDSVLDLNNASYNKEHFDQFILKWKKSKNRLSSSTASLIRTSQLREVQYILTTGANWNGPIESFTLIITPENPDDLIIIKGKHPIIRNKDGSITITYSNYTPTEDLTIWFIH